MANIVKDRSNSGKIARLPSLLSMNQTLIAIDDLPRYSNWPSRLLGLEQWKRKERTSAENLREYEDEKWGPLARICQERGASYSLDSVSKIAREGGENQILCSKGEWLFLSSPEEADNQIAKELASEFLKFEEASCLIEIGAGFGNMFFRIVSNLGGCFSRLIAAEYAASGRILIQRIAESESIEVLTLACDFNDPQILFGRIPENAFILTCAAIPCAPGLDHSFVDRLLSLKPRYVAHYEPLWQSDQKLLSLMRNRYLELNDYNTNLIDILRHARDKGKIRIIQERDDLLRINPFMAYTLTVWEPCSFVTSF